MNLQQYHVPTRRDAGQEGCSTGRMQYRKVAVQEGCSTGRMQYRTQDRKDLGQV